MRYEFEVETFDKMWLCDHGFVDEGAMPSKEAMIRLSEETMECYSAWEDMRAANNNKETTCEEWEHLERRLLSELADVIQATANIALTCGAGQADMAEALWECYERNYRRGRMGGGA